MISPHFIHKGILPLQVDGDQLFYTKFSNKIYTSSLPGLENETLVFEFPISVKYRILGKNPFLNKFLRIGPHLLAKVNNDFIVSLRNKIWANINYKTISFNHFKGSRPLNIEFAKDSFYFGEYFSNPERGEVKIFSLNSRDENWKIIYTFPENSIRHIHSIIYDKYRDGFWIQTGDRDSESSLWFTADFKDVQSYGNWSQESRAVKIIPAKDYLIVPMDTPQQKNYINYFYPELNKFQQIAGLMGSAFHAEELEDFYTVSTVVEPSKINRTDLATIYLCKKGTTNWFPIFSAQRSRVPIKLSHYFRYAELVIVPSTSETQYLIAFGRSLKKYESKTLIWDTSMFL